MCLQAADPNAVAFQPADLSYAGEVIRFIYLQKRAERGGGFLAETVDKENIH